MQGQIYWKYSNNKKESDLKALSKILNPNFSDSNETKTQNFQTKNIIKYFKNNR